MSRPEPLSAATATPVRAPRRRRTLPVTLILPGAILLLIAALALAAPLLPLPAPDAMNIMGRFAGPSAAHWLGEDQFGRDVLSRLIWGARASLAVAASAAVLAFLLGTLLGVLAGFLRGWVEVVTMRGMDVLLSFPPILLAMIVVTLVGAGALTLVPVLVLVYMPGFARIAQAGVATIRSQEFVEAVRSLGAGRARIMWRTILPNVAGPLIVQLSLVLAAGIVLESGLSFLGLGVVPPTPSWGLMIAEARPSVMMAPLLVLWPCLALAVTIFSINAFCDGLRDLLDPAAARGGHRAAPMPAPTLPRATDALFELRDLDVAVERPGTLLPVLERVSLTVRRGETLALVGESGSGKSLTSLAAMGLLPPGLRVTGGGAWVADRPVSGADPATLRRMRGEHIAMIFQDPSASLNPVRRIGEQIGEALRPATMSTRERRSKVLELLKRVGIADPERRIDAYPHEMSGGMRQRVVIAMAIANRPEMLIADEPTTALDVTVQAQILKLLRDLRQDSGAGMLFISHSLPVVSQIADRIAVMYCGEIVEEGTAAQVFAAPRHPYTQALMAAIPEPGRSLRDIPGMVPALDARPEGCRFAPRCAHATAACTATRPALEPTDGHATRCIRWRDLCATT